MGKETVRRKHKARALRAALRLGIVAAVAMGLVVIVYLLLGGGKRTQHGQTTGRSTGPSAAEAPSLSLFYSCDLQGRLAPYTCEEGELGGVARMATVFGRWAKGRDHVLVDVGNSTASGHEVAETINAFTFSALDKLGYDVVNCGDNEAELSLDELRALAKDRKFKLISANLVRADTRAPIFPTHHIVRRRGLQIAFIGLLREDILPKHTGKGVRLISPSAALKGAINLVKDSVDLIVVLAFLPPEELHELARKHPEAHVFLGGVTPVSSPQYELAGPRANQATIVAYLGDQGCTVGRLEATFTPNQLPTATGEIALLDPAVEPDRAFAGLLADFAAALAGKPMPGASQDPKMPCTSAHVGSDVCKLCHIKQYYSWQNTAHAGAYVTLLQKGEQKNPACLRCHATGHKLPGGFDPDKPTAPGAKNGEDKEPLKAVRGPKTQDPLKGVGCECCHGGSRHHLGLALKDRFATARTPLLRPTPSLENCIRCHTPARPCREPGAAEPFDRTEYMDRIKHWD